MRKHVLFLMIFGFFFQTVVSAQTIQAQNVARESTVSVEKSKVQQDFNKQWAVLEKILGEISTIYKQEKMTEAILTKTVFTPLEARYKQLVLNEAPKQVALIMETFGKDNLETLHQVYRSVNPRDCILVCGLFYAQCTNNGCDALCQFLCATAFNSCVAGCTE